MSSSLTASRLNPSDLQLADLLAQLHAVDLGGPADTFAFTDFGSPSGQPVIGPSNEVDPSLAGPAGPLDGPLPDVSIYHDLPRDVVLSGLGPGGLEPDGPPLLDVPLPPDPLDDPVFDGFGPAGGDTGDDDPSPPLPDIPMLPDGADAPDSPSMSWSPWLSDLL